MCGRNWWAIGLLALALGTAIVIVAVFPVGFALFLTAVLLILCGVGLLRKR